MVEALAPFSTVASFSPSMDSASGAASDFRIPFVMAPNGDPKPKTKAPKLEQ